MLGTCWSPGPGSPRWAAPADGSSNVPRAVSNRQAVQSPSGASPRTFALHFLHNLTTPAAARELVAHAWPICEKLYPSGGTPAKTAKVTFPLLSQYSDQMTQLIFDLAGGENSVSNLLP